MLEKCLTAHNSPLHNTHTVPNEQSKLIMQPVCNRSSYDASLVTTNMPHCPLQVYEYMIPRGITNTQATVNRVCGRCTLPLFLYCLPKFCDTEHWKMERKEESPPISSQRLQEPDVGKAHSEASNAAKRRGRRDTATSIPTHQPTLASARGQETTQKH